MAQWCVLVCLLIIRTNGLDDIQLTNGVRLVQVDSSENEISEFRNFLTTHQLQVQLDEILPTQNDVQRGLKGALEYLNKLDAGTIGVTQDIIINLPAFLVT